MSDEKMIKIKLVVNTGFPGAEYEDCFEMPAADYERMTPKEQEKFLDDEARDFMENVIEYYAEVAND